MCIYLKKINKNENEKCALFIDLEKKKKKDIGSSLEFAESQLQGRNIDIDLLLDCVQPGCISLWVLRCIIQHHSDGIVPSVFSRLLPLGSLAVPHLSSDSGVEHFQVTFMIDVLRLSSSVAVEWQTSITCPTLIKPPTGGNMHLLDVNLSLCHEQTSWNYSIKLIQLLNNYLKW